MKHEIKQRTLTIKEPSILEKIISENIEHIKMEIIYDNGHCIVMKYPDYKNQLTFGKRWISVYKARPGIQIRTPNILRPYAGKVFDIYQEKIDPEEMELFRMRPIGFELNLKTKEKKERQSNPVFSKTGFCVIPKPYVINFIGESISGQRLSFHKTGIPHIQDGYLIARITKEIEYGNLSFPIHQYGKKFRTRPMKSLISFLWENGKSLQNFYYDKTIYNENYDLIIFREAVQDE